MRIRECHSGDRRSLAQLGHSPQAIETLSPTLYTRFAWAIRRTRARSFVIEEPASGELAGSVQFVRSGIDPHTWMFGHWRVSPEQRGRGTGGALLRGALARIAGVRRLYSLIETENEASRRAHERLGFERASRFIGGGPLGFLSTIGPPAPAVRMERVTRGDREGLFDLYRQAMGPLWGRLFPELDATRLPYAASEPPEPAPGEHPAAVLPDSVMIVHDGDGRPAFVARSGRRTCLFCNPERCDAGLLARIASRLLALGAGREQWLALRGLPDHLGRKPDPIETWIVMGSTDLERLRNEG